MRHWRKEKALESTKKRVRDFSIRIFRGTLWPSSPRGTATPAGRGRREGSLRSLLAGPPHLGFLRPLNPSAALEACGHRPAVAPAASRGTIPLCSHARPYIWALRGGSWGSAGLSEQRPAKPNPKEGRPVLYFSMAICGARDGRPAEASVGAACDCCLGWSGGPRGQVSPGRGCRGLPSAPEHLPSHLPW